MQKNYATFASVYDAIMDDSLYDQWLAFTKCHAQANTKKILEMACGTGKLARALAREGYEITALDYSAEMLAIASEDAREAGIDMEFVEGDMRHLEDVDCYDAVTCYSDSLCYLADEADLQSTFDGVYRSLRTSGRFLFDVHSIYQVDQGFKAYSYHVNAEDYAFLWDSYPGNEAYSVEHELTFFVKDSQGLFVRKDELHCERTYSLATYQNLLENAGFSDVAVYADFTDQQPGKESRRWFFVATK